MAATETPRERRSRGLALALALALAGLVGGCSRSPERVLADQFSEIIRLHNDEGVTITRNKEAWLSRNWPNRSAGPEVVHFKQRLHELMDARFGGSEAIRYSREQHIQLLNEILAKYHPDTLERLKKGDYGVDGFTGEPGGDPRGMILCDPGHPDDRGDGTAPAVPDKAMACADFYAEYIESLVAAPFKLKAVNKRSIELAEATEKTEKILWGVTMEEWGNGGGAKGFDMPATLRALILKYHPQDDAAFRDLARLMTSADTPGLQTSAKQELLGYWRLEREYHEKARDGGAIHGYWTGDVSGLFRIAGGGDGGGSSAREMAGCDDAPLPAGGSLGPIPGAPAHVYFRFHMLGSDEEGKPLAIDTDGSGKAWHNLRRFAVCAYPAGYGRSGGRQTYLVGDEGIVWAKDTGGLPVDRLPKDLDAEGWSVVERPAPPQSPSDAPGAPPSTEPTPAAAARPSDQGGQDPSAAFKRLLFAMRGEGDPSLLAQQVNLTPEQAALLAPLAIEALPSFSPNAGNVGPQETNLVEFLGSLGPRVTEAHGSLPAPAPDNRKTPVDVLAPLVGEHWRDVAPLAARAIARIVQGSKPVPGLNIRASRAVEYLADNYLFQLTLETQNEKQAGIIHRLGELGPEASDAVPYLTYVLSMDGHLRPRLAAAAALARITGQAEPGVGFLVRQIDRAPAQETGQPREDGESIQLKCEAIAYLGELGVLARGAVPTLVGIIGSATSTPSLRVPAAHALVSIGVQADSGLEALKSVACSGDEIDAELALDALDLLGPRAAAVAPALEDLLKSGTANPNVQVWAAHTLVRITGRPEPGVDYLVGALGRGDDTIRLGESILALGDLGTMASKAVPALTKLGESSGSTDQAEKIQHVLEEIDSGIITQEYQK